MRQRQGWASNIFIFNVTGSQHSQADVGMRRQHVDIVLTQWVDDDGLAPINQVSSNLKDLKGKHYYYYYCLYIITHLIIIIIHMLNEELTAEKR